MEHKKVSAIILAAGEGTRIGRQKMLLPWGKVTVLERVIDNVLLSGVLEAIVVLGYKADEARDRLANYLEEKADRHKVKIVINPDFKEGMSSSLKRGLEAVAGDSRAVMVVLGDQPQTGPGIMKRILQAFFQSDKNIVVPAFKGQRGHPVVLDMKFKPEILNLKGDVGARELVKAHSEEILELDITSQEIIQDIDTWQDYEEIRLASRA